MTDSKWTQEELDRFKSIISEKKEKAQEIIERSRENAENMAAGETVNAVYSSHMADAGSDQMEREKEFFWLTRETTYMQYLNRALDMIDEGTFGICKVCGCKIPEERLMEVPHTTTCWNCKTESKKA